MEGEAQETVDTPAAPLERPAELDSTVQLVQSFAMELSKHIAKDELTVAYRLTTKGCFVDERAVAQLVDAYHAWAETKLPGKVLESRERMTRHLFGTETPSPFYVIEGSKSLCGYLIAAPVEQNPHYGIPLYRGAPLDARTYLHPRDPLFETLQRVKVHATPQGLEVRVDVHGTTIGLSMAQLVTFGRLCCEVRRVREAMPQFSGSVRDAVRILERLSGEIKVLGPNSSLIIPRALGRSRRDLKVYRFFVVILLVNRDGRTEECLSLDGKEFRDFVLAELRGFLEHERKIRDFRVFLEKRPFIGEVLNVTRAYRIELRALLDFLRTIEDIDPLPERFGPRFTLSDALQLLTEKFQQAEPVRVGQGLQFQRETGCEIRRIGNLEFLVTNRATVPACGIHGRWKPALVRGVSTPNSGGGRPPRRAGRGPRQRSGGGKPNR